MSAARNHHYTTMTKPITITGSAAALVDKYTAFTPSNPKSTPAHEFVFVRPEYIKDGILDPSWSKDGFRLVGWADITITLLPQDDMIKSAVDGLRAQKQKVIADAQAEATRIEGEIQKLLAITFEAPATTD